MTLLAVNALAYAVRGKKILHRPELALAGREIPVLPGSNGTGKSTLAYLIMGCAGSLPRAGTIRFQDRLLTAPYRVVPDAAILTKPHTAHRVGAGHRSLIQQAVSGVAIQARASEDAVVAAITVCARVHVPHPVHMHRPDGAARSAAHPAARAAGTRIVG